MTFKPFVRLLISLALFSGAFLGIVYAGGTMAISRAPIAAVEMPSDFPVEKVELSTDGQPNLSGWVSRGNGKCGVALILHGRGSNKSTMSERGKLLHDAGMSVVLFDLPGHGESGGDIRGFGYDEVTAVARMADYIKKEFPGQKTAAIGTSLGAASLVLAQERFAPDAYVLEELFATLEETTAKRMLLPAFQEVQAKIMLAQLPYRLGNSADDVRPVDRISGLKSPVLLLSGSEDPFADPKQIQQLYDAITAPKQLVIFEGAGHQNLQWYDPLTYQASVLPFVQKAICAS